MSKGQATIAHSPHSQLLMIDMAHHPVLVVVNVAVAEQLVARSNEVRSQDVVSLISKSHNMMMKMNPAHTNLSLDAELADDVVLEEVDAIQLRLGTMIS